MTEENVISQDEVDVFIEFSDQNGVAQASLSDGVERLKAESEKAMNVTMSVIRAMADRVSKTIETIEDKTRPDEMEIEFSLKLDLEGGAIIPMVAKTTAGGQFNIKFKWNLEKPNHPIVLVSENK